MIDHLNRSERKTNQNGLWGKFTTTAKKSSAMEIVWTVHTFGQEKRDMSRPSYRRGGGKIV